MANSPEKEEKYEQPYVPVQDNSQEVSSRLFEAAYRDLLGDFRRDMKDDRFAKVDKDNPATGHTSDNDDDPNRDSEPEKSPNPSDASPSDGPPKTDGVVQKADGSAVLLKEGKALQVRDAKGGITTFSYQGKDLVGMQLPDGSRWTKLNGDRWIKEGTTEIHDQKVTVDIDGTVHIKRGDIEITKRTDGWAEHKSSDGKVTQQRENPDGSRVIKNEKGQIIQIDNAMGKSWHFEYGNDDKPNFVKTPTGAKYTSKDGENWSLDGSSQTSKLDFKPSEDGSVTKTFNENGKRMEHRWKGDGSRVNTEDERVVAVNTAGGKRQAFKLGYDNAGNLNRFEIEGDGGSYWKSDDNKTWTKYQKDGTKTNETWDVTLSADKDGTITRASREKGKEGVTEIRTDGGYHDQSTGLIQKFNKDGSQVFTDKNRLVKKVIGRDGDVSEYSYSENGELIGIKDGTGEWSTKDRVHWKHKSKGGEEKNWDGYRGVLKDGTKHVWENGKETFSNTDGTKIVVENGTVIKSDKQGRIVETVDRNGQRSKYEYGTVVIDGREVPNQLVAVQTGNKPALRTTDGWNWKSENGDEKFTGVITLYKNGSLRKIDENAYQTTRHLDCVSRYGDDGQRNDLISAAEDIKNTLDGSLGNTFAGKRRWGDDGQHEVIQQHLQDKSGAEVRVINHHFKQKWGTGHSMAEVFHRKQKGHNHDRAQDYALKTDDANFDKIQADTVGKIRANIRHRSTEGDAVIRELLRNKTSEQIAELNAEYKRCYGGDMVDELQKMQFKQSEKYERMALRVFLKGTDSPTHDSDMKKLMDISCKSYGEYPKLENFKEAASVASDKARAMFRADGGQEKIEGAFWNWCYPSRQKHAEQYAQNGRLDIAQRIRDSRGWFTNNKDAMEAALGDMTEKEREMFCRGEKLAEKRSEVKNNGSQEDKEALDFYDEIHSAIDDSHWWNAKSQTARLDDLARQKGGSFIGKIADHGGQLWSDGNAKVLSTVENMTQQHFDQLLEGGSEARANLNKALENCLDKEEGRRAKELIDRKVNTANAIGQENKEQLKQRQHFKDMPEEKLDSFLRGRDVYRDLMKTTDSGERAKKEASLSQEAKRDLEVFKQERYAAVNAGERRSVLDALDDNVHAMKNDRKGMIDALLNMTPEERRNYKEKKDGFRDKLDQKIKETIKEGNPAYKVAQNILKQIDANPNEAPKLAPVDKLRMMKYDDNVKPADVMKEIEKSFREDPSLRGRLNADKELAREFKEAASEALKGCSQGRSYDDMVDSLLENGRLSAKQLIRLHAPAGSAPDIPKLAQHIAGMSPEQLKALNDDPKDREKLLDMFDSKQRPVIEHILNRGSELSATKEKLLNSLGKEDREKAEKIINRGGSLTEQDRKWRDSLKPEQQNQLDAILKGPVDAADKMRLFVTKAGVTKEDVMDILSRMSLGERQQLFSTYASRYGMSDLRRDLMDRADSKDKPKVEYLIRTNEVSAQYAYERNIEQFKKSDGFGGQLTQLTAHGASRDAAQESLNEFSQKLAEANARGEEISKEDQEKLEEKCREALVQFRAAKEDLADTVVTTVITVAAVAAAPFTSGASLAPLLIGAAAGAALKVGTHALICGEDFDATTSNVARKMASGMVEGAFAGANPGHVGAVLGIGKKAAVGSAKIASRMFARLGGKELSKEAQAVLASEMKSMVGCALTQRAAGIAGRELEAVAEKMVKRGLIEAGQKMALVEAMQIGLNKGIAQATKGFVRKAQYEFAHAAANAVIGAGSAGSGVIADGLITGDLSADDVSEAMFRGAATRVAAGVVSRGITGVKNLKGPKDTVAEGTVGGAPSAASQRAAGRLSRLIDNRVVNAVREAADETFESFSGDVVAGVLLDGQVDLGQTIRSALEEGAGTGARGGHSSGHKGRSKNKPHDSVAQKSNPVKTTDARSKGDTSPVLDKRAAPDVRLQEQKQDKVNADVRVHAPDLTEWKADKAKPVQVTEPQTGQAKPVQVAESQTGQAKPVQMAESQTGQAKPVQMAESQTGRRSEALSRPADNQTGSRTPDRHLSERKEAALVAIGKTINSPQTVADLRNSKLDARTLEFYAQKSREGYLSPDMLKKLSTMEEKSRRSVEKIIDQGPKHTTAGQLRQLLLKDALDKHSAYNLLTMPKADRKALLDQTRDLDGKLINQLLKLPPYIHRVTMKSLEKGGVDVPAVKSLLDSGRQMDVYKRALETGSLTRQLIADELSRPAVNKQAASHGNTPAGDSNSPHGPFERGGRFRDVLNWRDVEIADIFDKYKNKTDRSGQEKRNSEIRAVLYQAAREYSEKVGLVLRDADGRVTKHLISPDQIKLVESKSLYGASYHRFSNHINVAVNGSSPTVSLRHEMDHMLVGLRQKMAERFLPAAANQITALKYASLMGGSRKIVEVHGNVVIEKGFYSEEARQCLKGLFVSRVTTRGDGRVPSLSELIGWVAKQKQISPDTMREFGGRLALARVLHAEISNYQQGRSYRISDAFLTPDILQWMSQQARRKLDYAARSGKPLHENAELLKDFDGVETTPLELTSTRTGNLIDPASYFLSVQEARARRAEVSERMLRVAHYGLARYAGTIKSRVDDIRFGRAITKLRRDIQRYHNEMSAEGRMGAWRSARDAALKLLDMTSSRHNFASELVQHLLDLDLVSEYEIPEHLRHAIDGTTSNPTTTTQTGGPAQASVSHSQSGGVNPLGRDISNEGADRPEELEPGSRPSKWRQVRIEPQPGNEEGWFAVHDALLEKGFVPVETPDSKLEPFNRHIQFEVPADFVQRDLVGALTHVQEFGWHLSTARGNNSETITEILALVDSGLHLTGLELRAGHDDLSMLARKCPDLEYLDLRGFRLNDAGIMVLSSFRNLRGLCIRDARRISDTGFAFLGQLTKLERLELERVEISPIAFTHLENFPRLHSVTIKDTDIGTSGFRDLGRLPSLRSLFLRGTNLTDATMPLLSRLKNLQDLHIIDAWEITDAGLAAIGSMTDLRNLSVTNSYVITDAGVAHFSPLIQLESLNLDRLHGITDASAPTLSNFKNLTSLDLTATKVTSATVEHLKALANLEVLALSSTAATSDGALEHIPGFTKLHTLRLEGGLLTDAGLEHVGRLSNLRVLELNHAMHITDAGLAHLNSLSNLANLNIAWTGISDAGLVHLTNLSNLRTLDATVAVVTPGSNELNQLSQLYWVVINGPDGTRKYTPAELRHLTSGRPIVPRRRAVFPVGELPPRLRTTDPPAAGPADFAVGRHAHYITEQDRTLTELATELDRARSSIQQKLLETLGFTNKVAEAKELAIQNEVLKQLRRRLEQLGLKGNWPDRVLRAINVVTNRANLPIEMRERLEQREKDQGVKVDGFFSPKHLTLYFEVSKDTPNSGMLLAEEANHLTDQMFMAHALRLPDGKEKALMRTVWSVLAKAGRPGERAERHGTSCLLSDRVKLDRPGRRIQRGLIVDALSTLDPSFEESQIKVPLSSRRDNIIEGLNALRQMTAPELRAHAEAIIKRFESTCPAESWKSDYAYLVAEFARGKERHGHTEEADGRAVAVNELYGELRHLQLAMDDMYSLEEALKPKSIDRDHDSAEEIAAKKKHNERVFALNQAIDALPTGDARYRSKEWTENFSDIVTGRRSQSTYPHSMAEILALESTLVLRHLQMLQDLREQGVTGDRRDQLLKNHPADISFNVISNLRTVVSQLGIVRRPVRAQQESYEDARARMHDARKKARAAAKNVAKGLAKLDPDSPDSLALIVYLHENKLINNVPEVFRNAVRSATDGSKSWLRGELIPWGRDALDLNLGRSGIRIKLQQQGNQNSQSGPNRRPLNPDTARALDRLKGTIKTNPGTIELYAAKAGEGYLSPQMLECLAHVDKRTRHYLDRIIEDSPRHTAGSVLREMLLKQAFNARAAYNWWCMPSDDRGALIKLLPLLDGPTIKRLLEISPGAFRYAICAVQEGKMDVPTLKLLVATERNPESDARAVYQGELGAAELRERLNRSRTQMREAPDANPTATHSRYGQYTLETANELPQTWRNVKIRQIAEWIGNNPADFQRGMKAIQHEYLKELRDQAKRRGFVLEDAQGNITHLINLDQIILATDLKTKNSYCGKRNVLTFNIATQDPTGAAAHELDHMIDLATKTIFVEAAILEQQSKSPVRSRASGSLLNSWQKALVSDLVPRAAEGDVRTELRKDELWQVERLKVETEPARRYFKQALADFLNERGHQAPPTEMDVQGWVDTRRPAAASVLRELGGKAAFVVELLGEISAFYAAQSMSRVGSETLKQHPNLSQFIKSKALAKWRRAEACGKSLESNPEIIKHATGQSDDLAALASMGHYLVAAPVEIRARLAELAQRRREMVGYGAGDAGLRDNVNDVRYLEARRQLMQDLERFWTAGSEALRQAAWENAQESARSLLSMTSKTYTAARHVKQFVIKHGLVSKREAAKLLGRMAQAESQAAPLTQVAATSNEMAADTAVPVQSANSGPIDHSPESGQPESATLEKQSFQQASVDISSRKTIIRLPDGTRWTVVHNPPLTNEQVLAFLEELHAKPKETAAPSTPDPNRPPSNAALTVPTDKLVGFFNGGDPRPLSVLVGQTIVSILANQPMPKIGDFAVALYADVFKSLLVNGQDRTFAGGYAELEREFAGKIQQRLPSFRKEWKVIHKTETIDQQSVDTLFGHPEPASTDANNAGQLTGQQPEERHALSLKAQTIRNVIAIYRQEVQNNHQIDLADIARNASRLRRQILGTGGGDIGLRTVRQIISGYETEPLTAKQLGTMSDQQLLDWANRKSSESRSVEGTYEHSHSRRGSAVEGNHRLWTPEPFLTPEEVSRFSLTLGRNRLPMSDQAKVADYITAAKCALQPGKDDVRRLNQAVSTARVQLRDATGTHEEYITQNGIERGVSLQSTAQEVQRAFEGDPQFKQLAEQRKSAQDQLSTANRLLNQVQEAQLARLTEVLGDFNRKHKIGQTPFEQLNSESSAATSSPQKPDVFVEFKAGLGGSEGTYKRGTAVFQLDRQLLGSNYSEAAFLAAAFHENHHFRQDLLVSGNMAMEVGISAGRTTSGGPVTERQINLLKAHYQDRLGAELTDRMIGILLSSPEYTNLTHEQRRTARYYEESFAGSQNSSISAEIVRHTRIWKDIAEIREELSTSQDSAYASRLLADLGRPENAEYRKRMLGDQPLVAYSDEMVTRAAIDKQLSVRQVEESLFIRRLQGDYMLRRIEMDAHLGADRVLKGSLEPGDRLFPLDTPSPKGDREPPAQRPTRRSAGPSVPRSNSAFSGHRLVREMSTDGDRRLQTYFKSLQGEKPTKGAKTLTGERVIDDELAGRIARIWNSDSLTVAREELRNALNDMRSANRQRQGRTVSDLVLEVLKPAVERAERYGRWQECGVAQEVIELYASDVDKRSHNTEPDQNGRLQQWWENIARSGELTRDEKLDLYMTIVRKAPRNAVLEMIESFDLESMRAFNEVTLELMEARFGSEYRERVQKQCALLARRLHPRLILPASLDNLITGLPANLRQQALDKLVERRQFLSEVGIRDFFRILDKAIPEDAIKHIHVRHDVTFVVDSWEGRALAQLFRKATGKEVNVYSIDDLEVPRGNGPVILFTGKRIEDLSAQARKLYENRIVTESGLQELVNKLFDGPNLYDLMLARQVPAEANIARLRQRLGLPQDNQTVLNKTDRLSPVEYESFRSALEKDVDLARERGIGLSLATAYKIGSNEQAKKYIHDLLATAAAIKLFDTRRSFTEAKRLHSALFGSATGQIEHGTVFVAYSGRKSQGPKVDSLEHTIHLYRLANGLSDARYNEHFLTEQQFKSSVADGTLKGVKRIVVIDDVAITAFQALERMSLLSELCDGNKLTEIKVTFGTLISSYDAHLHLTPEHPARRQRSAVPGIPDLQCLPDNFQFVTGRVVNRPLRVDNELQTFPAGWAMDTIHLSRVRKELRGLKVPAVEIETFLDRFRDCVRLKRREFTGIPDGKPIQLVCPVMLLMAHNSIPAIAAKIIKNFAIAEAKLQHVPKNNGEHSSDQPPPVVHRSRQPYRDFGDFKIGNFGIVEGSSNGGPSKVEIWRGGALSLTRNIKQPNEVLKQLREAHNVGVIVDLRNEFDKQETQLIERERELSAANGIEHISWKQICEKTPGLEYPLDMSRITARHLQAAARVLHETVNTLRMKGAPAVVYVHCQVGVDRTGAVLRQYQVEFLGVNPKAADREMRKYAGVPGQWRGRFTEGKDQIDGAELSKTRQMRKPIDVLRQTDATGVFGTMLTREKYYLLKFISGLSLRQQDSLSRVLKTLEDDMKAELLATFSDLQAARCSHVGEQALQSLDGADSRTDRVNQAINSLRTHLPHLVSGSSS